MEKKTPEEIIAQEGFTKSMLIPHHLVETLMYKYAEQADQETAELREENYILKSKLTAYERASDVYENIEVKPLREENERLKKEIEQLKIPKMNQGGWLV